MSPEDQVVGWDIGGAHVKATLMRGGSLADVTQWAAPLWQGLDRLDAALDAAAARWPGLSSARHAVTMTAEMTDLFAHREAGVAALVARVADRLGPAPVFYAGAAGWLGVAEVGASWRQVASANWLATAECVGRALGDALLVDIGSTTTDIVPVRHGRAAPAGRGDADRLAAGELVYLGVVRTPLCVLAERIGWRGRDYNVMNEFFATTADAFRLSGRLEAMHDQYPPADGGSKSAAATCNRLARLIGHDGRDAPPEQWQAFARAWVRRMADRIADNIERVSRATPLPASAPIVGAGCGSFLAHELAERLARPFVPFHRLLSTPAGLEPWVDTCAPSAAIASLYTAGDRPCG